MLYRENGQFKTSYRADQQIFPILQDRIAILAIVAVAVVGLPLFASDYLFRAILIPFAILAIAALGLNILVGYCGQISLGTGAFMAVGAYAAYNFTVRIPGMPLLAALLLGGVCATAVGVAFGIPLGRIWVIVWTVAGCVALVAGIIWGSKLGVQFSLSLVALKALPVVILGGLTSVPGAIIGGLIIGVGEKLSEVYIGPHLGGGVEIWFAYVVALAFLLVRPQGLFGEKIIDRV